MTEPAHYKRGPSGAHRWLICTDSPEAEEGYPDETSDAADEGTAAHWLLEQCLKSGQSVEGWIAPGGGAHTITIDDSGQVFIPAGEETGCIKDWPITGEMIESVQLAIDTVNEQAKKRGTKLFVEERVRVGDHYGLQDVVGGTADIIMYLPKSKTLYVLDFKYGKGHVVEVGSDRWSINPQVGIYAIAALSELERLIGKRVEVKWIVAGIIQPRAYHKKGHVRTKKLNPMQLMGLEADLIQAVNGPKERVAGEHCHFCRAKPDCAEYHTHRGELATEGFEAEVPDSAQAVSSPPHHDLTPVDQQYPLGSVPELISRPVKGLTLQELARARGVLGPLKAWVKEVEEEVRTRLLHDLQVPGARLAQGRGSRAFGGDPDEVWRSAVQTAEELGANLDDFYEPAQLKSPAKLEKEFGKSKFQETPLAALVTYTEGGPVVVDEDSDKPDYVKDGGFKAETPPESPLL